MQIEFEPVENKKEKPLLFIANSCCYCRLNFPVILLLYGKIITVPEKSCIFKARSRGTYRCLITSGFDQ